MADGERYDLADYKDHWFLDDLIISGSAVVVDDGLFRKPYIEIARKNSGNSQIYDYFFDLIDGLVNQGESLEILLGAGILNVAGEARVHHPLLTVELEIKFDAARAAIWLIPRNLGPNVGLEMLSNMLFYNTKEIINLRDEIEEKGINLFDHVAVANVLTRFIHFLHPGGRYFEQGAGEGHVVGAVPTITHSLVLVVRAKSTVMLKQDLRDTISYLGGGGDVTKSFRGVIDPSYVANRDVVQSVASEQFVDDELCFLPMTDEQKSIVSLLERNDIVTVSGGSGTGKTHTIINLMTSLIAGGKRILVLSDSINTLRLVKQGMPEFLDGLSASVFGDDSESKEALKKTIAALSKGLQTFDAHVLASHILSINGKFKQVDKLLDAAYEKLSDYHELETKEVIWRGEIYQSRELVEIVKAHCESYYFVKDSIAMHAQPVITEVEFERLIALKDRLRGEDESVREFELPDMFEILYKREYQKLADDERAYTLRVEELLGLSDVFDSRADLELAKYLESELPRMLSVIERVKVDEDRKILDDCLTDLGRYHIWQLNCESLEQGVLQLYEYKEKASSPDEGLIKSLNRIFPFDDFNLSDKTFNFKNLITFYEDKLIQLKGILEVASEIHQANTTAKGLSPHFKGISPQNLDMIDMLYEASLLALGRVSLDARWAKMHDYLLQEYQKLLTQPGMHPICKKLYDALVANNQKKLDELMISFEHLVAVKKCYNEIDSLVEKLRSDMPLLAEEILQDLGRNELRISEGLLLSDVFEYAKLQTFIGQLEDYDVAGILEHIDELDAKRQELQLDLALKKSWKSVIERAPQGENFALQTILQKLSGVFGVADEDGFITYFHEDIKRCQLAIPAWIMNTRDAIESFRVDAPPFDVVLIDDASLTNVFSVPVLMRAKKAVLFGDEMSGKPKIPNFDESQAHELLKRYATHLEEFGVFDFNASLFDVINRRAHARVNLTQNFRSPAEILRFANEILYEQPLKTIKERFAGVQPIESIYVTPDVMSIQNENLAEALKIASDLKDLLVLKTYENKTIGIISLSGSRGAKLVSDAIKAEVDADTLASRNILCGEPNDFRGLSRDIIFLSLGVLPGAGLETFEAKTHTIDLNIATTRARCQMRLYHSVELKDLNPNDLRYKLLAFMRGE